MTTTTHNPTKSSVRFVSERRSSPFASRYSRLFMGGSGVIGDQVQPEEPDADAYHYQGRHNHDGADGLRPVLLAPRFKVFALVHNESLLWQVPTFSTTISRGFGD